LRNQVPELSKQRSLPPIISLGSWNVQGVTEMSLYKQRFSLRV
jgi:hypothetical protein